MPRANKKSRYYTAVCYPCGTRAGRTPGLATYHDGVCDVCGDEAAVTQPRDFGYPEFK